MADYSEGWRQYLEIEEKQLSVSEEVLARFHTHLRNIPGEETVQPGSFDGRFGDTRLLYEGYPLEEYRESYQEFLETLSDEEGFTYPETADLHLILGTELEDLSHVRKVLEGVENNGATPRTIRRLGELTSETLEQKI